MFALVPMLFYCFVPVAGSTMFQENVAIGIIPEYFDRYYSVAVNVYLFTPAMAVIVSPLLTSWLLDIYGWRGTLLLLCGINTQSVVLSALAPQRPPSKIESEEQLCILHTTQMSKEDTNKSFSIRGVLRNVLNTFNFQLLKSLQFVARIILPGITQGYIITCWMIYIISFALSNGVSMRESSVVATWGGVGVAIIRIPLPTLNKYFTYRKLMYAASLLIASNLAATTFVSSIIGMSSMSIIFGMSYGTLNTQLYIAVNDVVQKDQYLNAVSWYHLAHGFGSIVGGAITGTCLYLFTESTIVSTKNLQDLDFLSSDFLFSRHHLSFGYIHVKSWAECKTIVSAKA